MKAYVLKILVQMTGFYNLNFGYSQLDTSITPVSSTSIMVISVHLGKVYGQPFGALGFTTTCVYGFTFAPFCLPATLILVTR